MGWVCISRVFYVQAVDYYFDGDGLQGCEAKRSDVAAGFPVDFHLGQVLPLMGDEVLTQPILKRLVVNDSQVVSYQVDYLSDVFNDFG